MIVTAAQLAEIIEDLKGTCSSLNDVMPTNYSEDDLTIEQHEEIDLEIFKCAECDWWCERSEESEIESSDGESYCNNCRD